MEPMSTFNFGNSAAQGLILNRTFQLKNLADKANNLLGPRNSSENFGFNGPAPVGTNLDGLNSNVDKRQSLKEVAQKFEALLIHQMLKAMRQTVHKSDLLDSFSLQQYESMLDEEIANEMAEHRGIGLADILFYQLTRLEEAANPSAVSQITHESGEANRNE